MKVEFTTKILDTQSDCKDKLTSEANFCISIFIVKIVNLWKYEKQASAKENTKRKKTQNKDKPR